MTTPFDNRLLLVHWIARPLHPTRDIFGQIDPKAGELGISIRDFCLWMRREFPNLSGISVKTLHGAMWQGSGGSDSPQDLRAITSVDRLRDWLRACNEANLELHTWVVPVGRSNGNSIIHLEIAQLAQVMSAKVDGVGVRSLSLDVEAGHGFWTGSQTDVAEYWTRLKGILPDEHIALILDYRFRRQGREAFIMPWLTRSDSLHPMVYPGEFFPSTTPMPVEREMQRAFDELKQFNKPIVPMIQLHDASRPVKRRTTAAEIAEQGEAALRLGGVGVTAFRTGTDHFQSDKWPGLAAIQTGGPIIGLPPEIPAHAVVVWPEDPGYMESIYPDNPPDAPLERMLDVYGRPVRFKHTVPFQGATAEYRPTLPARAVYRVQAFIPANVANAMVEYRIMDRPGQPDAEVVTPRIDQARFSNQWITLGEYTFDPDVPDSGKVSLTDIGPDNPPRTVVFGAIRWERLVA